MLMNRMIIVYGSGRLQRTITECTSKPSAQIMATNVPTVSIRSIIDVLLITMSCFEKFKQGFSFNFGREIIAK